MISCCVIYLQSLHRRLLYACTWAHNIDQSKTVIRHTHTNIEQWLRQSNPSSFSSLCSHAFSVLCHFQMVSCDFVSLTIRRYDVFRYINIWLNLWNLFCFNWKKNDLNYESRKSARIHESHHMTMCVTQHPIKTRQLQMWNQTVGGKLHVLSGNKHLLTKRLNRSRKTNRQRQFTNEFWYKRSTFVVFR